MSEVIIFDRMQQRRGTAADLTAVNEVLRDGEHCVETDTGKFKIGDGSTAWSDLPYQGIWTLADIRRALDLLGSTAEGDIIYKGPSGWTRLPKGADDDVLTLAGGLPSWAPGGGGAAGYLDPSTHMLDPLYDFTGSVPTSTTTPMVLASTGGGVTLIDGGAGAPGVWRLASGTSGPCNITVGSGASLRVGDGVLRLKWRFRLPVLSDATNRYTINIGLRDVWPAAVTHRLDIRWSDNTAGGAMELVAGSGSTTFVAGTTVLVANTFYDCVLEVAADGLSASLYLDGGLEATVNTNMPTGAMYAGFLIQNNSGASRNLDMDYFAPPQMTFTTPR